MTALPQTTIIQKRLSKTDKLTSIKICTPVKIIHLVEMKFSERPFTITKDYEQRLKTRKNLFMEVMNIQRGPVHTF